MLLELYSCSLSLFSLFLVSLSSSSIPFFLAPSSSPLPLQLYHIEMVFLDTFEGNITKFLLQTPQLEPKPQSPLETPCTRPHLFRPFSVSLCPLSPYLERSLYKVSFQPLVSMRRTWSSSCTLLRSLTLLSGTKRYLSDTIYALSSGQVGKSGVAVIRLSGSESFSCLQSLIRQDKTLPKPRQASVRRLICPQTNELLDKAIVLWFPGPSSYTGEDMVEFHVHGSIAVLEGFFVAFDYLNKSSKSTIRPAEKGEFTRRAYENAKMDLTEIEGVGDLLCAETSSQRKQALRQMEGHMRRIYEAWRDELKSCLAHTEAVIDFGDDDRENDINDDAMWLLLPRVQKLREQIRIRLEDHNRGEILRDGVRIALVGLPNAGKSSILNYLARRPAAIVSPIPGTTRDVVEVRLNLGGISCILKDTAGFRENNAVGTDLIEMEGMRRAREVYSSSHLVIFVVDHSDVEKNLFQTYELFQSLEQESPTSNPTSQSQIVLLNKMDLQSEKYSLNLGESIQSMWNSNPTPYYSSVSCLSGQGMDKFENELEKHVKKIVYGESQNPSTDILVTRQRHRSHLQACVSHLDAFLTCQLPMDLAAEELRLAMKELGKITGTVEVDELLTIIFRDFCIGK